MNLSYSTRWLTSWVLVIFAVLALVAGAFTFATDWRRGLGLCLIALGIAVPTLWWLRHTTRSSQAPRMKSNAVLGILVLGSGLVVFPWNDFALNSGNNNDIETAMETNSVAVSPRAPDETTSQSTSKSTEPEEPSKAIAKEPSVEVETVVTTQAPETVTEVETMIPPRVTVYREVPQEPAPQSTQAPTVPSQRESTNSGVPENSQTVPPELTEPTDPQEESEPAGQNQGQIQDGTLGAGYRGVPQRHQQDTRDQVTNPAPEGAGIQPDSGLVEQTQDSIRLFQR